MPSPLPTPVCCIHLNRILMLVCLILKSLSLCSDWSHVNAAACPLWLPPLQGGNTIRQLLKIAKKTVPEEDWRRTPVVLKATAGLRLLPEDKANALLKEVKHVFSLPSDSLAQTAPVPPRNGDEKPLSAYKCHNKKREGSDSTRSVAIMLQKNSCCGVVWSKHICHLKY